MIDQMVIDKLLNILKEKGIFSEYLPENFNMKSDLINIYGAGASHKDKVEPYSYYMSRFGKVGDRRMISIPEVASYISLINFLSDNKEILEYIIEISANDINSFSRIANEEYEIIEGDDIYGEGIDNSSLIIDASAENQEEEKERSIYVENMLKKIQMTRGASGILHIDISEFYKSIYTHTLSSIKLGIDEAKEAFQQDSQDQIYKKYVALDDRVRRLNGARTNGILVGPYISRILSEALLARVDIELRAAGFTFLRYADDYEIAIYKEEDLEDVKSKLVSIFERYSFRINNEKTIYERYPFYMFMNYEKIIRRLVGKDKEIDSVEVVELFNKFLQMEKSGEKGAVRYLLKTYKNEYHVADKQLYASYLLNVLCNDEKALGLACKIIIHEYNANRIELDERFYSIIVNKLQYEIKKQHDLEIVWLTYLLKYTNFPIAQELLKEIIKSKCDLAIVIVFEEWSGIIENTDIEWCWENSTSWILLYQIALRHPEKRVIFYQKLGIVHNQNFYDKLFDKDFTFYKKSQLLNEVLYANSANFDKGGALPPIISLLDDDIFL